MKLVCLLPVATDARIQRRLGALRRHGIDPEVLAFERPQYPGRPPSTAYQSLGVISHGRYVRRLGAIVRALPLVRSACVGADVVYAFSLDLLALAWLATRWSRQKPRFVYEVADVRAVLVGNTVRAGIFRALERHLLRGTSLLVVTSQAYISGFYHGVQNLIDLPHLLIENKPDLDEVAAPKRVLREARPLTIGYFGLIRCRRSWEALQRIAASGNGRIRVHVRGTPLGIPEFEQDVAANPWIEYGGPYLSPDDLREMYARIDLCWIAHRMNQQHSLLWNRANRFYEACAFHTPMIAQAGTQDGAVVARDGLGVCIDLADPDAAVARVVEIDRADMARWQRHMLAVPRSVYTENGEHQALANAISRLAAA
jgi:succinoglycan biosynthesis protein ExoL